MATNDWFSDLAKHQAKNKHIEFTPDEEYEYLRRRGEERFGSECEHAQISNGHCVKCLRKVWQGR